MNDLSTLYCQLDALRRALRPLDDHAALSPDTLTLIADLQVAVSREMNAVGDAIDAENDTTTDEVDFDAEPRAAA